MRANASEEEKKLDQSQKNEFITTNISDKKDKSFHQSEDLKQVSNKGRKRKEIHLVLMTPNLHKSGHKHQKNWLLQRIKPQIYTHLQSR